MKHLHQQRSSLEGIPVEKDPERLAHMLGTDLRDTVPPQLYALIAAVVSRLEDKEDGR